MLRHITSASMDSSTNASNKKRPYGSMTLDSELGGDSLLPATADGSSIFHTNQQSPQQLQGLNNNRLVKPLSASITLPIGHQRVQQVVDHISIIGKSMSGSSLVTSSSASAANPANVPKRMDNKKIISSPQEFFTSMLHSRGYPATMVCSLKCGYHNSPTTHQTKSYGVALTKAIRSSDTITTRSLLATGLHPNACNKFGESIVHAACRRGDFPMLHALIEAGSSVQVTDDFGRTPLHDACWTSSPNFDTIRLLLDQDPWLLCIMDCRGSTPLGYVRKAHWAVWIGFLGAIADRYWPDLENDCVAVDQETKVDRPTAPPLSFVEPNSRQLPDPKLMNGFTLEILELLANGKVSLQDLKNNNPLTQNQAVPTIMNNKNHLPKTSPKAPTTVACASRITLDPLRQRGSNATTMMKGGPAASLMDQGFLQVAATTSIPGKF